MTSLTCIQIQELIPHRYPFLLVDAIEEIDGIDRAVGIKNVSINEPFFQGHFPGFPIMPGVLIIEAMAQTAGAVVCHHLGQEGKKRSVFFMSIEEARFRKPVLPGHQLRLIVEKIQSRRTVWKFKGIAMVGDELHAEATFTAMITEGVS